MSLIKNSFKHGIYILALSLLFSSNPIFSKGGESDEEQEQPLKKSPKGDKTGATEKGGEEKPKEGDKKPSDDPKKDDKTQDDKSKENSGFKTQLSKLLGNRKVLIVGGASAVALVLAVVYCKLSQESKK